MTDLSKITEKLDLQKIIAEVKSIQTTAMTKINAVLDALHSHTSAPDVTATAAKPQDSNAPAPDAQAPVANETKETK